MLTAIERFPALDAHSDRIVHGFVRRIPDLDVHVEREAALARLADIHREARAELGLAETSFVTAKQVHGAEVAAIPRGAAIPANPIDGVDAIVTTQRGVCLGIFVADCAAVYLFDPKIPIIGLVHSGKKGTALGVVRQAIRQMQRLGADPENMVAQIGPSIRPPNYEIDFTAEIVRQCRQAGLNQVHDCGVDTFADPGRYYSYRREKGRTGRMLALLALR